MEVTVNVYLGEDETNIEFDDSLNNIKIETNINGIVKGRSDKDTIYFLLGEKKKELYVGKTKANRDLTGKNFDKIITVSVPSGVSLAYLEYIFYFEAKKNSAFLMNKQEPQKPNLSENQERQSELYKNKIKFILSKFGIELYKSKKLKEPKLNYNNRRPPFTFYDIGLKDGEKIEFIKNPLYKAEIVDDKVVMFEGKEY
ncbi:MAG: hypothetical protein LBD41_04440, partial [Clostridiales Family XIII bacterium]|nr:hypothetical protein [Clostridiales Family XIII bacterium]